MACIWAMPCHTAGPADRHFPFRCLHAVAFWTVAIWLKCLLFLYEFLYELLYAILFKYLYRFCNTELESKQQALD